MGDFEPTDEFFDIGDTRGMLLLRPFAFVFSRSFLILASYASRPISVSSYAFKSDFDSEPSCHSFGPIFLVNVFSMENYSSLSLTFLTSWVVLIPLLTFTD